MTNDLLVSRASIPDIVGMPESRHAVFRLSSAASGTGRGFLARLALAVVATVAVIVSAVLGAMIMLAVIGLGAIAAIALSLRVWWLRRRHAGTATGASPGARTRARHDSGTVIEGEFTSVETGTRTHDRRT